MPIIWSCTRNKEKRELNQLNAEANPLPLYPLMMRRGDAERGRVIRKRRILLANTNPKTTLLILLGTNQRTRFRQILKAICKALIGFLFSQNLHLLRHC